MTTWFSVILGHPTALFVTALVSLWVVVDPTGNIFAFLALSSGCGPAEARALARRACTFSFLILAAFVFLGRLVLGFFGISLAAFQIAGGLILFRIAFDMLEGRGHFQRLDTSSSLMAADYRDIALVPLAVPLLSGPGAISTILVLTSRSAGLLDDGLILLALFLTFLCTYLFFRFAQQLSRLLKESGIRLLTRLMGLILAALAVQFVLDGVRTALSSGVQ
ncbi:MAG: NAAT family transporter [Deltaproteobacteria bacterium]|nr:NAAT family transporter [Deltaproteobacteria bacterium]